MTPKSLALLSIVWCFMVACETHEEKKLTNQIITPILPDKKSNIHPDEYNNTKGYWDNGEIITSFDCPDAVGFFPPINIVYWDKTPAVNGRFPTYEETKNGSSIHHYGEKENANVKPYAMTLPRLATHYNRWTNADGLVVVIQIVQTAQDTIVGYRYLSGGCGGDKFNKFHFLNDDEVKKEVALQALKKT